jgi:TatD DNase family protein
MEYIDIHTHQSRQKNGVISVQSLSLTSDIFLAMPKTKSISVGLHPWFADIEKLEMYMKYLNVIARQANVKMIGECGLDKLKGEKMEGQLILLKEQIQLAEVLKKPLILHCVKSFDELIAIKDEMKVKVPMIIHGFNKKLALGEQLLNKGFYLSFGAAILKTDSSTAKLVQHTDRFFLETDDKDVPIEEIYQQVAILKKSSVEQLKARIFADWEKIILNKYG